MANQKGFVSYYFLDANPEWLEQLKKFRRIFRTYLYEANEITHELKALSLSVDWLIEDIDHKHNELEKNKENMIQAEKLAVVGKLAAGTAHSIRNPLTSVKMRLFSLNRSLHLTPSQQDDFKVISDEIRHIDSVVTNFLEFSRPPKINIQKVCINELIENTANLLKYRYLSLL